MPAAAGTDLSPRSRTDERRRDTLQWAAAQGIHHRRRRPGRLRARRRWSNSCAATFWPEFNLAVITNDIYTREDAEFLAPRKLLPLDRIVGVETGGCPHSAIREDASINLAAVAELERKFPDLKIVIIESGGDNLAATFSPELADRTIYVIDVAEGDKIPRKGGPGITRSDLLVINKIDLAPHVGADLDVMRRDSTQMRGERPFLLHQPAHRRRRRGDAAMGAEPARITAADFVTPPEFRALSLAANESGRVGGVRLELVAVNGFTKLGACYQQVPLRVLPPFQFDAARPALLLSTQSDSWSV